MLEDTSITAASDESLQRFERMMKMEQSPTSVFVYKKKNNYTNILVTISKTMPNSWYLY